MRVCYGLLLLVAACGDVFGPDYFEHATPIVADTAFARIWEEVEDCSGLSGDFASVRWFRAEALPNGKGGWADRAGRRIVILGQQLDDWCEHYGNGDTGCLFTHRVIGHEVAHLLAPSSGHVMPLFSKHGPCGEVIATVD